IAGMIAMTALLLTAVHGKEMAPAGSSAVVAGASGAATPGTAGLLIAAAATPTATSSASAFAF
ncbi:hypothetical protein C5S29_07905, partial [ANME-1 cluster archaeon GoMg3.2]|nr:hypothetical protein [ANME-1 cluster archaeon GoMg3.2]